MTERDQAAAELAVVIVSYNVRDLLAACLRATMASLAQSGYAELGRAAPEAIAGSPAAATVIVVDNASTDGSAEMVAAEFPGVRLIASPTNHGFAAGNNLALRLLGFNSPLGLEGAAARNTQHAIRNPQSAPPQFVLLLNPDAEPLGDAIGRMAGYLAAHPQVGGVGAQLQYPDGRFQHGAFHFPDLWQLWFDFFPPRPRRLLDSRLNGRYPRARYAAGQPFPIDFALGAALMARREAIQAAGLLDEEYFMYAEEVDWCWRIRRAGWPFYCVPAARVIHHGGASTRQFRAQSFMNLWQSRQRLYDRFYGPGQRALAGVIVRVGMWAETRRARAAAAGGAISAEELAARLAATRAVQALFARNNSQTGG
jgi:GT2 family glycosyltransferase